MKGIVTFLRWSASDWFIKRLARRIFDLRRKERRPLSERRVKMALAMFQ